MSPEYSEAFVDVVQECHEIINRLELRGASLDDVNAVEKAIDLAIERRFSEMPKEYVLRDVLRNGRFIVRRSRARERRYLESEAVRKPRAATGKAGVAGELIAPDSPVEAVAARTLLAHLHEEAGRSGAGGVRILEGLLRDEMTATAAEAAGVSLSTANRVIRRLRTHAEELTG